MLLRTTLHSKTKTPVRVRFSMLVLFQFFFFFFFFNKAFMWADWSGFLRRAFSVALCNPRIDAKTCYLPVSTESFAPARINCRFSRPLAGCYILSSVKGSICWVFQTVCSPIVSAPELILYWALWTWYFFFHIGLEQRVCCLVCVSIEKTQEDFALLWL